MLSDIPGERGTHVRFVDHVKALIESKIAEHDGRLIRTFGDGLFVEFDSAVAVRCGVEIQRGLAVRNATVDPDRQIRLRIGVNVGDVIVGDRDIYGNGVNIAARPEAVAEPGEAYVTQRARDQLNGQPSLRFEDRGKRHIKNIGRPIRVYRVRSAATQQPTAFRRVIMRLDQRVNGIWRRSAALLAAALAAIAGIRMAAFPGRRDSSLVPPRAGCRFAMQAITPTRNISRTQ